MTRFGPPDGKWCKVEIMGHVEHVARALEAPLLDGKALRVCDETESKPILYGLGAIFSIRWLTDEEGDTESARRLAAQEEYDKRRARGAVIGAIQQTIRDVIDGKKMAADPLYLAVLTVTPGVAMVDFAEALEEMYLSIDNEDKAAGPLYWHDPDEVPW